jgi:hypothetical protein
MEVRIATESYKNNNDVIGQFINERIEIVKDQPDERMNITNVFNEFRLWAVENLPKGKKRPDRNQIKAYLEKMLGAYPLDNKGWKGLKYKNDNDEE